jgi:dihydroneopterin aldolase
MDKVFLEDIRFMIAVGVTAEERSCPQPCRLDVTLGTDLTRAGETGDLAQSVDYTAVFETLERVCTGGSFQLLEEIAHQACQAVLSRFPVKSIKLTIRKLQPFTDKVGAVGIEITRM